MSKPTNPTPIPPTQKARPPTITVSECAFYGVKWDEKATAAVAIIAEALREDANAASKRAEAVLSLSEVFRASNITINSLLHFDAPTISPLPVNSGPSRD